MKVNILKKIYSNNNDKILLGKRHGGFTLVELIVYIGIASMVILALSGTIIQITRIYSQSKAYNSVSESGNSAMQKISQEILAATSINEGDSDFISQPSILALNNSGTSEYRAIWVETLASGNKVLALETGDHAPGTYDALTSETVNVQTFSVDYIEASSNTPPGLKINLTLRSNTTRFDIEENFITSVNLRTY